MLNIHCKWFLCFGLYLFVLLSGVATAMAQDYPALTPEKIEAFLASYEDLGPYKYTMVLDDGTNEYQTRYDKANGERFGLYSNLIPLMKEQSQERYDAVGEIVKKHGFSSPEDWAATGDFIYLAYSLVNPEGLDHNGRGEVEEMEPETLALMPENVREYMQLENNKTRVYVEAAGKISNSDKEAVKPYMQRLEDVTGFDKATF